MNFFRNLLLLLGVLTVLGQTATLAKLSNGQPDTLEIVAMLVEFRKESPDNSLTTGLGTFGSDQDSRSKNYSLDPQTKRGTAAYWENHFEFAKRYFAAASNGKLFIESNIYPKNRTSYTLDKYIIDYNRTARKKDEKVAEYDEAKFRDYMAFVRDAVRKADADPADSPFRDSLPTSPNRHRVYLIIHAGASRLVDGGSMGTTGADTPGDFMDVFVPRDAWNYLATDTLRRADSAGVAFAGAPLDTLHEVMVLSETASQDGLNWGINGILINQIGRQIGLPNTYDVVNGISRMGSFDMMDFAGYNAGNGFLPVLPSAWLRAYLGWSTVRELRPGTSLSQAVSLAAAGSGLGDEILKVPLTANEYLLIENRQRTLDSNGQVTVDLDDGSSRTVGIDSLNTIFQDSTCGNDGVCKVNSKKAKGVILGLSSFDAGLPAAGVLVWHVNEWYLRESLKYGAANFWGGDTLRDHQFGLALVEADRILSIGKTFQNALGQDAYDYGSGADLLPHARYGGSVKDTVDELLPSGYANTGTTFGGMSGIHLVVSAGAKAQEERTSNGFLGDSVLNWRSPLMNVRVEWNNQWMPDAKWPRRTIAYNTPSRLLALEKPTGLNSTARQIIIAGSADGSLQAFAPRGDTLLASDTTVLRDARIDSVSTVLETINSIDSASPVSVYRLARSAGALVGVAGVGQTVWSLHRNILQRLQLSAPAGLLASTRDTLALPGRGVAGPLVSDEGVWVVDSLGLRLARSTGALQWISQLSWPSAFVPQQLALCGDVDADGVSDIAVVGTRGVLLVRNSGSATWLRLEAPQSLVAQHFQLACTDFNRDGSPDAFVLGERGMGWIMDLKAKELMAPARQYARITSGIVTSAGDTADYLENSPIALGDVNGDHYPDAVFYGHNRIFAIDSSGVPLTGFPVRFTRGSPEYGFGESPLLVNVDGQGSPEILGATTSGLLYAFNAQGKALTTGWPRPVGDFAYSTTIDPVGLLVTDGDTSGELEVFASHRDLINGYGLSGALAKAGASWLQAGGSPLRQNWLDASVLGSTDSVTLVNSISDFILFPNPVKGGIAKMRFTLGAPASSATLSLFDLSGRKVFSKKLGAQGLGRNQIDGLDFSKLGSDLYAASLDVVFTSGVKKTAWDRIATVK